MSLSVANSIASSALRAAQVQMSVASANIANADTEGYTRKTSQLTTNVSSGLASGVSSETLTSAVNSLLTKQWVSASSSDGETSTLADYADQLQSLYGETTSSDDTGTSLASLLDDLESALSDLAATPESNSLKSIAVSALSDLASGIQYLSSNIQSLRENADSDIASAVEDANTQISAIDGLNDQIVSAKARGDSTADLEDQRSQALLSLSSIMNVKWSVSDSGAMTVYTGDGSQALVNSSAHLMSFDTSAYVSADTSYPTSLSGISVDGKDITSSVTSGSMSALLTMRDETLVSAQDELDTLASGLIDAFNAVSNSATAVPAPNSLTGTQTLSGSDSFSATGSARFAVVDSDGALVSYADLDLSSYSTVDDLVSAIDDIDGISASLDSQGHLTISADNSSYGVSLGALDSAVGSTDESFSSAFGMNDLFTGTDASSIAVNSTIAASNSLLPSAVLADDSTLSAGDKVLTSGDETIAAGYAALMSDDVSFAASGALGAETTNFASYMADIVSARATLADSTSSKAENASSALSTISDAASSESGVNLDEETQRLSDMQQLYEAAAKVLSTAQSMFEALLSAMD